jgi:fumarate reductase subunit C
MNARIETTLWLIQRLGAMVLAITVTVHIGSIILAMRGGLSAHEIITRVQGNMVWFAFYLVFIIAVAVHGPLGLRTVLREMTPLPAPVINMLMAAFAVLLAGMGWRAASGLVWFEG